MLMSGGRPLVSSRAVRWLLGGLLLTAALLKGQQGIAEAGASLSLVVPAGELFLSLWLISGRLPVLSLRIASLCFVCFALISAWKISNGTELCGCFGRWEVSPKLSYWIDWIALWLALWALGKEKQSRPRRFGFVLPSALVACSLALFIAGLALWRNAEANPALPPGRLWPPAGAVTLPADLSSGRWVVLLYRSSCGRCLGTANEYADLARRWQSEGRKIRVALIDGDPGAGMETPLFRAGPVEGTLEQAGLLRSAPVVLVLDGGRVLASQEGWEGVDWNCLPYSKWIE